MSEPFLAEIKIVGFNFAPRGFAFCDGQILPINQNQSLFSLLGTTYGGDGRTSFALPELRGRVPVHEGANGITLGQKSGAETATLAAGALPAHSHGLRVTATSADGNTPGGKVLAGSNADLYALPGALVEMASDTVANTGGQSHNNMQPFLALNFVIALSGLFPSRN
jgi:microcystin-dependent protein